MSMALNLANYCMKNSGKINLGGGGNLKPQVASKWSEKDGDTTFTTCLTTPSSVPVDELYAWDEINDLQELGESYKAYGVSKYDYTTYMTETRNLSELHFEEHFV